MLATALLVRLHTVCVIRMKRAVQLNHNKPPTVGPPSLGFQCDEKGFDAGCIRVLSGFTHEEQNRILDLYERQDVSKI